MIIEGSLINYTDFLKLGVVAFESTTILTLGKTMFRGIFPLLSQNEILLLSRIILVKSERTDALKTEPYPHPSQVLSFLIYLFFNYFK